MNGSILEDDKNFNLQVLQNKAHRLFCILYRQRKTNDYIHENMIHLIGQYEPLLSTLNEESSLWSISRQDGLAKTI